MKFQKIISVDPGNNYEKIGEVDISTNLEIDDKIKKAHEAKLIWFALGFKGRIELLEKLYKEFANRKDEISLLASREMGMPISTSKEIDIGAGLSYMRGYLDLAQEWLSPEITFENNKEIHYQIFEPRGIVGVSIPWNFPFCNFVWGVVQNLIVGNVVVFKHSEECPLTGKLLEEIVQKINLPEGVFSQVYGDGYSVGEYLMNHSLDMIYFTGSTGVGRHLYQVAAKKLIPLVLELGGSAPGIVFSDADLDTSVESIYSYRFENAGQICDGLKRLIVHRSIFDTVVHKLKTILATKKIGVAQNMQTDIGPLVAERQVVFLEQQVQDALQKGAKIVTGGKRPKGLLGAYYEPTILTDITFDMKVWKEEVFGPVLPIVPFDSYEDALALANDTQYGLGAYVYSKNTEQALQFANLLNTGNVSINGANYNLPQDPFGGYKNSGIGREHGKIGLRSLCNSKLVALRK